MNVKSHILQLKTTSFCLQIRKKKISTIKNYANMGFVNIVLERFYTKVEKIAEKLGTKPDTIITHILLLL